MSKNLRKVIAACVTIIYLISIATSAVYAAPSDISGHPAASIINDWISKGLADVQSDLKFRPDEVIKRIEFITYINKVFNFTEKASTNIVDVITKSDDGNEVAKAVAAGYLQVDGKKKVYPYQAITKLDAVVMLAKVFELKSSNTGVLNKYSDFDKIPSVYREAVSALVEKGYVSDSYGGKFSPYSNLTRSQAITIIDNTMGEIFNSKGVYKGSFKNNVVVNTESVTLKNMTIGGDLYLTEGIGDGDITLDKIIVKGRTIIRGGGRHSIIIKDSVFWGQVLVNKKGGAVRLVAEGNTNIYNTRLNSGAILEEDDVKEAAGYKGFDEVQVSTEIPVKQEIKLDGGFGNVDIEADSVNFQVDGDVSKLQVKESGENTNIKIRSGNINELSVQADRASVEAIGGTVTSLKISNTADASSVKIDGASVGTLDVQASSNINVAKGAIGSFIMSSSAVGSSVVIGKTASVPPFSAPGVAVTDNRTSSTTNLIQYITMSAQNLTVMKGSVTTAVVGVTPADSVLNYNSLNPTVATVNPNDGVVKGESVGTATIMVTATKTGYYTTSRTFTVTVTTPNTNQTAAGTLILNPMTANSSEVRDITLTYTPGEALANGTVIFNLPVGFQAGIDDRIKIGDGNERTLKGDEIFDSGRTVTLTGVNATASNNIVLTLANTTIPVPNSYSFNVTADADGTGVRAASAGTTDSERKTLVSTAMSLTLPGTLAIQPTSASVSTTKDITLTYTPGESLVNGMVVFTLPSQFTAGAGDTVTIKNAAVPASQVTYDGRTVTVTGVNTSKATNDTVVLTLNGKIIPALGDYYFNAKADADGLTGSKLPSTGDGNERQRFSSVALPTMQGILDLQPTSLINGSTQTLTLTYTPGENLTNGTVIFTLPASIAAQTSDEVIIGGGAAENLTRPGELSNNNTTVTLTGVTMSASGANNKIVLTLKNKVIPSVSATYDFKAAADADGTATAKGPSDGTGTEMRSITSITGPQTETGIITITPGSEIEGTAMVDIALQYKPGETLTNGIVKFYLPAGFTAQTGDTYRIGGGSDTPLASGQIDPTGRIITLQGVNATTSDLVVLTLNDKTIPAKGTYDMYATADADGASGTKAPSPGTVGSDRDSFVSRAAAMKLPTQAYTTPVAGTLAGTTRIAALTMPTGIGATKWQTVVQNGSFGIPELDSTIASGAAIYTAGSNIGISANQHLLLAATDDNDKIKAYADLIITSSQIRGSDAPELIEISGAAGNYSAPVPGNAPGTTSIADLRNLPSGATQWQVKVQSTGLTSAPIIDTKILGASLYNVGDDIANVSAGQYLILLATDGNGLIKAYTCIQIGAPQIRNAAGILARDTNYSAPEKGDIAGTTKITYLNKGNNLLALNGITVKWMYVVADTSLPALALDSTLTGAQDYTLGASININAGKHFVLLATDASTSGKIKAYADIVISSNAIKPYDADVLLPGTNYSAPVAGSKPETTMIQDLKLNGLQTGLRWKVKVQSAFSGAPALDSIISDAVDYKAGDDIKIAPDQYILLLAVDSSNRIKAYASIQVGENAIQAPLATPLVYNINYETPVSGVTVGSTKINLYFAGLAGAATKWQIAIQNSAFAVPAYNSIFSGTLKDSNYTSGNEIQGVSANQHILIMAVDVDGKIKAYADIQVTIDQIKADIAKVLTSANYSMPEPGNGAGTTKIATLKPVGFLGIDKWQALVKNSPFIPDDSSIISGASDYTAGTDISIAAGQHLILLATDSTGRVKAYADLTMDPAQIREMAAKLNLSIGVGATAGTTTIVSTLPSVTGATMWQIKVQNSSISAPVCDSIMSNTTTYSAGASIPILAGQHLIVLATDISGKIKAYDDILVTSDKIMQATAALSGSVFPGPVAEHDINIGGKNIVIALTNGQWAADIATSSSKRNALFDGFAAASEQIEWAKVISALKADVGSITRDSDTQITISLPESPAYNISVNQSVTLNIPVTAVVGATSPIAAATVIQIAPTVTAAISGTVTAAAVESGIKNGGYTIVVTLASGQWVTDVASDVNKRDALFAGLKASGSEAGQWDTGVVDALTSAGTAAIIKNSSTKITITLPPVSGYDILNIQTVTLTIPSSLIIGGTGNVVAAPSFQITPTPPSAPIIDSITASEGGVLEQGLGAGDKLVIHFDVPTNQSTAVTYANKTAVDAVITWNNGKFFGTNYTGAWTDSQTLVITCTNAAGATFGINDTITIKSGAGIKTSNGLSASSASASGMCTGTFNSAPLMLSAVASEGGAGENALGVGDVLTITFDVPTNKTIADAYADKAAVDTVINWNGKPFGSTYTGAWTSNKTLVITCTGASGSGYHAVGDSISINTSANIRTLDGKSDQSDSSIVSTGSLDPFVYVTDINTALSNGTYGVGQVVPIVVTFDSAVDVAVSGTAKPLLHLETGAADHDAAYASGSGTAALVFNYTVVQGDNSDNLDYKDINSLVLNGATIRNKGTSTNAVLTLPGPGSSQSLGGQKAIRIDTAEPVNTPLYPRISLKTGTTANVLVQTNEKGTAYYVVLNGGSVQPTNTQVKNGTVGIGIKGNVSLQPLVDAAIPITGLTLATAYDIYIVCEDEFGNLQALPTKVPVTTTADTTPPSFASTYPKAGNVGGSTADILVNIDEAGTVYYAVLASGSAVPTSANVRSGTGAIIKGSFAVDTNHVSTECAINVPGLSGATSYDIYVVCEDVGRNLQAAPVKVPVTTDLSGVTFDVTAGKILNTSANMEYSLDSTNGTNGTWVGCADGSTAVQFTVGTVYVRNKKNPALYEYLGSVARQTSPSQAALDDITYNIAAGTITDTTGLNNLQYRINGGAWTEVIPSGATSGVVFTAGDLEFRLKGDSATLPSLPVLKVTIAAPTSAPGLDYDDVKNTISDLGRLNQAGTSSIYEYKIGTGAWTSGEATPDLSGSVTVYVRLKATGDTLPSQVQTIVFSTDINLKVVGYNVLAGQLTGTTTAMEYSQDSSDGHNGTWKACSNTNTNITFAEGLVYVRAAVQHENIQLVVSLTAGAAPSTAGITFNVAAGTITIPAGVNNLQYRIGSSTWANISEGTKSGVAFTPGDVQVRTRATAVALPSQPGSIAPTIAAPGLAPSLVYDDIANSITGLTNNPNLEYKIDNGAWTTGGSPDFSGTKTVYIRYKATASELPSQIQTINFTTNIGLDQVGINVAGGIITGTTTAMQYSLNSTDGVNGAWYVCSANNTAVTFTAGKVFVRAAAQTSNKKEVAAIDPPAALAAANEVSYDISQGTITVQAGFNDYQYRINSGAWMNISEGVTTGVAFTAGNFDVRKRATASTLASAPLTLDNLTSGAAPGLLYDDISNTITNLNNPNLEYKIDNGTWISGDAPGTPDFSGTKTVYVRYKATASELPSMLQTINFTTNIGFSEVGINVAGGLITGTTTAMQYSLNSTDGVNGTWYACSSNNTAVTFIVGKVFVRAAAQPSNKKEVATIAAPAAAPDVSGIDYDISAGTITIPSGVNTLQYRIAGGTWTNISEGVTGGIAFKAGKLEFRTRATDDKLPSLAKDKAVIAAAGEAPTLAYDDVLNTITGLGLASLEYKIDNGSWIQGDTPGAPDLSGTKTVYVRYKATAYEFASQTQTMNFTTNVGWSGLGIDIINRIITGTETTMQYSLTSTDGIDGTWHDCTSVSTNVTFTAGKVYLRAKAQPLNNYYVTTIAAPAAAPNVTIDTSGGLNTVKLQGVDTTMEYSKDGGVTWWAVTASYISGIRTVDASSPTADLRVRVKATDSILASQMTAKLN